MALRNILGVIFVISLIVFAQQFFLGVGASSLNDNIQPLEGGCKIRFAVPSVNSQFRTVPVIGHDCFLRDLSIDSHVVRGDYVVGKVTNNCKFCAAADNITVDCSQVKSPIGTICKDTYPLAFGEKWSFPYQGKPTTFKILSADFQNC